MALFILALTLLAVSVEKYRHALLGNICDQTKRVYGNNGIRHSDIFEHVTIPQMDLDPISLPPQWIMRGFIKL